MDIDPRKLLVEMYAVDKILVLVDKNSGVMSYTYLNIDAVENRHWNE